MTSPLLSIALPDAHATAELAHKLAPLTTPGDVILLHGDLGAGKTYFARAFIQSLLSDPEDIPSPTFTLVQTYDTPLSEIWHADLYRLSSVHEVEELGLIDAFDAAICLVEWPDRLAELSPNDALSITLSHSTGDTRVIDATWTHPKWNTKLSGWTK